MKHMEPSIELENINPSWRIGIIGTQYYEDHITAMTESAKTTLVTHGINEHNVHIYNAYGSWEVPLIGAALAKEGKVDALIGFGIIIQGETYHDQHLARESARGMMDVQIQQGIPFGYEILHIKEPDQLTSRISGVHCKGKEAALAVLHSLQQLQDCKR